MFQEVLNSVNKFVAEVAHHSRFVDSGRVGNAKDCAEDNESLHCVLKCKNSVLWIYGSAPTERLRSIWNKRCGRGGGDFIISVGLVRRDRSPWISEPGEKLDTFVTMCF